MPKNSNGKEKEKNRNIRGGKCASGIQRPSTLWVNAKGQRRELFSDGTVVLDQRLHFLLDALVPLGDVHVQRVVAAGFAVGPPAPLLKG